jgi:hypothetical protein
VTLATTSFSLFLRLNAFAQQTAESSSQRQEENQPPSETRQSEQSTVLETLWKLLRRKRENEPARSSRGDICEITGLLEKENIIWSDRPLFIWLGTAPHFKVRLYSPFNPDRDQEVIWSQTVTQKSAGAASGHQSVAYTGEALQPGLIYDWELEMIDSSTRTRRISFQIMNSEERERIAAHLAALEAELTARGATEEEIAIERAHYFAEQDLWSDALRELYSVENPSAALARESQNIIAYLCNPVNSEVGQSD